MPSPQHVTNTSTVILDNGGADIKACLLPASLTKSLPSTQTTVPPPLIAANALAKASPKAIPSPASLPGKSRRPHGHLVAAEIAKAPDVSAMTFRRPHDRGIVTSFDVQRDIWASVFSIDRGIGVTADMRRSTSLVLTEALGIPIRARRATDQLVFEVFKFHSCAVAPPQRLSALNLNTNSTALVIDSGFSATTAVPVVNRREIAHAARRLSLGGKALTNLLKQTVSFRSWNMSDETAVMNAVKERCCYVSSIDYMHHLPHVRELRYLLPDPTRFLEPYGRVCPDDYATEPQEQVLSLKNERIAIPEALFYPADIGVGQAGIAELVIQAVEACDEHLRPDLYANVILTGGNCKFAGFRQRFEDELRPMVCVDFDVRVHMDEDPALTPFYGGARAVLDMQGSPLSFVTRERYQEVGTDGILRELYGDDE